MTSVSCSNWFRLLQHFRGNLKREVYIKWTNLVLGSYEMISIDTVILKGAKNVITFALTFVFDR